MARQVYVVNLVRRLVINPNNSIIYACIRIDIELKKYIKEQCYTMHIWSIKQSKRHRKRVGEGYQSGAYSQ